MTTTTLEDGFVLQVGDFVRYRDGEAIEHGVVVKPAALGYVIVAASPDLVSSPADGRAMIERSAIVAAKRPRENDPDVLRDWSEFLDAWAGDAQRHQ